MNNEEFKSNKNETVDLETYFAQVDEPRNLIITCIFTA